MEIIDELGRIRQALQYLLHLPEQIERIERKVDQMALNIAALTQAVSDVEAAVSAEADEVQAVAGDLAALAPDTVTQDQLDGLTARLEASAGNSKQQAAALAAAVAPPAPPVSPQTDPAQPTT